MSKNNDSIANLTLRVVIITVCAGLVLGLMYAITKDPIAYQEELKATTARQDVLPEAKEFQVVDTETLGVEAETYEIINAVYQGTADGETVGYTFDIVTKG